MNEELFSGKAYNYKMGKEKGNYSNEIHKNLYRRATVPGR